VDDPLLTLRQYRGLAPWSLRDLVTLATAILDAAQVRPINAAANARPSERTVRFYVTRGLVAPPEGRGTAATYSYRHLLQVLTVKLRQMEGGTLSEIAEELQATTGDVLERRVAAALGPGIPSPDQLRLGLAGLSSTGRTAKAIHSMPPDRTAVTWHRISVAEGIELHVSSAHDFAARDDLRRDLADAVRVAARRIDAARRDRAPATPPHQPSTLPPEETTS
jgi:DNA-binding transcriptional MerR regulator